MRVLRRKSAPPNDDPDDLAQRLERWADAAAGAWSTSTARAFATGTAAFLRWCQAAGLVAFPAQPDTLRRFVDEAGLRLSPATLSSYLWAVGRQHRAAKLLDPTAAEPVRLAIRRHRRRVGRRQAQAGPLLETEVAAILATTLPRTLIDQRDLALLLLARDTLCRRSELVGLRLEDLRPAGDGSATVLLRRGKTDQEGQGSLLYLGPRAHQAVQSWATGALMMEGPILRVVRGGDRVGGPLGGGDVSRIFKKLARRAGLDPARVSGHSTRVGMAQDLEGSGATLPELMTAGRWRSPTMPARYTEHGTASRGAVARYSRRRGG